MSSTICIGQHHRNQLLAPNDALPADPSQSHTRTTTNAYSTRNWRPVPSGIFIPQRLFCNVFWPCYSRRHDVASISRCPPLRLALPAVNYSTDEFNRKHSKLVQVMRTREGRYLPVRHHINLGVLEIVLWHVSAFRWMDLAIREIATRHPHNIYR
jgi:hypothetical protein